MTSLAVILALLLKLLSVGEMSPLSVHVISHVIGTPLGLYMAHLVCLTELAMQMKCGVETRFLLVRV